MVTTERTLFRELLCRSDQILTLSLRGAGVFPAGCVVRQEARSIFSTAISIFSMAIPDWSEAISGTFHLYGQPL